MCRVEITPCIWAMTVQPPTIGWEYQGRLAKSGMMRRGTLMNTISEIISSFQTVTYDTYQSHFISRLSYRKQNTLYYRFICCGNSLTRTKICPVGARVTSPCAHGDTVLFAGCVIPHHPPSFKTRHTPVNFVDAWKMPSAHDHQVTEGILN